MITGDKIKCRTIFMSDYHLGSHNCQAKRLYNFLSSYDAERIYLIGDIIEFSNRSKWPAYHNDILRILSEKSLAGCKIVFIPGNHDSIFRQHVGQYGNLRILKYAYHKQLDGSNLLVTHGDETDLLKIDFLLWCIIKLESLLKIHLWEIVRTYFPRWILVHTNRFEKKILALALKHGVQGVVCGHVHLPKVKQEDGFVYLNTGDWVQHCTAIIEDCSGTFSLVKG